ncbi:alpha/beta fold hydrolase [Chondromyces crocatus]|uniref:Putative 2-succinyl-6-hydroxy-2,4-cyclohexadiene-1-carboxylate synthase n=1 Tax=Chondromyces crocatus TaxID=52 RepID=A0A0K1E8Q4_CHOCO|nr:alpha/beta fold hydrolase [Chondromyces crocatus]AKT36963.1 alpha/beta hydrolase [Chondromyces crocatus]
MTTPAPAPSAPALHRQTHGSGPRLVLVHGFTQNGHGWADLPGALQHDHEVVRVDLPGHGRSSPAVGDLWDAADRLGDAGGRAAYLGYSLGGRVCLHLALARPDLVRALVLVGATPGIEDSDARAEREASDRRLADRLERIGVSAFLDEWLAQPLFSGLPHDTRSRAAREENTPTGLASALRHLGTGTQTPLWSRLHQLTMPILLITGARDEKFTSIARRMLPLLNTHAQPTPSSQRAPTARLDVIPDAGHAAHLERPDAFLPLLRHWLRKQEVTLANDAPPPLSPR